MPRRRTLTALALATLAATAGPAHAVPPTAQGWTCGMTTSDDGSGAWMQVGPVQGGPVTVTDSHASGNPASATITCTVQVNVATPGTPFAIPVSATGTGTATLPPTLVAYAAEATDWVYLCTEWTLTDALGSAVTLYWDAPTGLWTSNPAAATCAVSPLGPVRSVAPVPETAP